MHGNLTQHQTLATTNKHVVNVAILFDDRGLNVFIQLQDRLVAGIQQIVRHDLITQGQLLNLLVQLSNFVGLGIDIVYGKPDTGIDAFADFFDAPAALTDFSQNGSFFPRRGRLW